MKIHIGLSFSAFVVMHLFAIAGRGETVSIAMDSLPSAQGWAYTQSYTTFPESNVFTLQDGQLHINTIEKGLFSCGYQYTNFAMSSSSPFSFSMRVALRGYEVREAGSRTGFGIFFWSGTEVYLLALNADGLSTQVLHGFPDSNLIPFDTGLMHDYRMEVVPGTGYKLYVDDVLVDVGVGQNDTSATNTVVFGDLAGASNSAADIASFSFFQAPQLKLSKQGRVVTPSFSYLTTGTNYQLQISTNLATWSNQGSAFTATNRSMDYPLAWNVDNGESLFFRLTLVP